MTTKYGGWKDKVSREIIFISLGGPSIFLCKWMNRETTCLDCLRSSLVHNIHHNYYTMFLMKYCFYKKNIQICVNFLFFAFMKKCIFLDESF